MVQGGISEKVGTGLQYFSMFLSGFIIGFVKNWKLSLVILSVVPLLVLGGAIFGKLLSDAATSGQSAYAKAGGVAEEVLSGIRTIVSFGSEDSSTDRYRLRLDESVKKGIRKGHFVGLGLGYGAAAHLRPLVRVHAYVHNRLRRGARGSPWAAFRMTFFVMFSSYGLAFWYGSVLINSGEITAGEVVTVFFGTRALISAAPPRPEERH